MAKIAFVVMAASALDKEIKSIGVAGNKLNTRIQLAACNAIHYSIAHGDVGFGQRLVLALNNGQRKNSLVAFLEKFGKFQWNKEEKSLVYRKRDDIPNTEATTRVEAITEMWFDTVKPPAIQSMYDFDSSFEKFIKSAKKMAENPDIVFEGGEDMSALLEAWASIKAAKALTEEEAKEEIEQSDVTTDGTFTAEEVAETAQLMALAVEGSVIDADTEENADRGQLRHAA